MASPQSKVGKTIPDELPNIDRDVLMKKLEKIPLETLRGILTNQVDLEIRLKHRELRLTDEEMGKCEAQMLALRKFFEVPNDVQLDKEPNDFTIKYFDLLNKSLSVSYTQLLKQRYQDKPEFKQDVFEQNSNPGHYRTRSTTSSLRPSFTSSGLRVTGCLYRRTDGVVVKLTCPDCQRSNFSSAQGFLNHSRIAHSQEYTSQDAAALRCGEILPDDLQDEEGLASLKSLRQKNKNPSENLNINEIYFNGLSNSLNTVHRGSLNLESQESGRKTSRSDGATVLDQLREKCRSIESSPHTESQDHSHAYRGILVEGENHALMNKLISSGVAHDADEYKSLIEEARRSVPNSHLFEDEEEIADDGTEANEPTYLDSSRKPVLHDKTQAISENRNTKTEDDIEQRGDGHDSHAAGSGKYENRLRRRKSRVIVGVRPYRDNYLDALEEEEKQNQAKRRRK